LTHPNIVAVFEHGKTVDAAPYMVMNYIAGTNLAQYVRQHGALPETDAVKVFIDIAEALDYAHHQNLIHRDLKPSNVIITGDNEQKTLGAHLVDFGIAKAMTATMARDTQDLTKTGEVFGSPAYMSPEQCLGFRLDARSDIYSFGCLMYEAITGNPPVSDENPVRIVVKQLSDKPTSWTNTPAGKPLKGLEAIVFRCLEKDKEERYQTVADLLKDLNMIAAGKQPAKFEPSQTAKASMTAGQAVTFAVLGIFFFLYVTSVYISYIYSIFNVILFPVALTLSLRHLILLKFGGTNWNRWQLIIGVTMTLVGLTGLIVFTGVFPFWENLPEAFQFFYAIDSVLHKALIGVAVGIVAAAFAFQDNANLSWKKISKQAAISSLPIMILSFVPLGSWSPIIPSSLTTGMPMSYNAKTPKVNIALAKTALSLGGDKVWAANMIAENYIKLDESEKALPYLTEAIEKDQKNYRIEGALESRARAYLSVNQYQKAMLDITKLLNKDDTGYSGARYYELQGDAYQGEGEIKKATTSYRNSIERSSISNPSSGKLIGLLIKQRDWKPAIAELNHSVSNYNAPVSVLQRAMVYDLANLPDNAKSDYKFIVNQLANLSDKPPPPIQLDGATAIILKIIRDFSPREDYRKLVGAQYLIRAYANKHLNNTEQAFTDRKEGEARGAKFSDINPTFEKDSGLKISM
jgi:tetratricopeptide (TPR) repeat protein